MLIAGIALGSVASAGILSTSATPAPGETVLIVGPDYQSAAGYTWYVDGAPISDVPVARATQLVIYQSRPLAGTNYRVLISYGDHSIQSETVTLSRSTNGSYVAAAPMGSADVGALSTPASATATSDAGITTAPTSDPAALSAGRLTNLSARGRVTPGTRLMAGLIITGSAPRPVLIRGSGPALSAFGVSNALADPGLGLYDGSTLVASNAGWDRGNDPALMTDKITTVGAFAYSPGSHDTMLFQSLAPGSHTAHVSTQGGAGSGTALIEFYDTDPNGVGSRFANLSCRGLASTGDDVLIVGFVIGGNSPLRVLVRVLGPALRQYGVSDAMPNPRLELFRGSTPLLSNDDWEQGYDREQAASVASATVSAGAVPLGAGSQDAALAVTLPPGAYTVIGSMSALGNAAGEVLVEVYEAP